MVDFTPISDYLERHNLVLLGLGREGLSSYRFIRRLLPSHPITLIDDQPLEQLNPAWREIVNQDEQVRFYQTPAAPAFTAQDLVCKTPGMPLNHSLVQHIHQNQIAQTSNLALFFEAIDRLRQMPWEIITIGVTGTKGKSTTTAVIAHVLESAGLQTWLGGNIGTPALDLLHNLPDADQQQKLQIVLELSCHQLDDLSVSPNIAVIQNIVPEHLDYYGSFERYVAAKAHIAQFQTENDLVVFNPSFSVPSQLAELSPAQKLPFVATALAEILPENAKQLSLLGEHNLENIMPAVVIGQELGLTTQQIAEGLQTFRPLPHRLEKVIEHNGVTYYNDSLSTVPEATIAAIKAMGDQPVILLAGGFDRGQDFGELADFIATSNVKALILFPATGEYLAAELTARGADDILQYQVSTMSEAMARVREIVEPGDAVLLSPASASFGQFKDYADRGDQFKSEVAEITQSTAR